jgi:hypothetical protein
MKYYCPKCFYKNEYKFKKPEKCEKCGFVFAAASKIEIKKESQESIRRAELEKRIARAEKFIQESEKNEEDDDFIEDESDEDENEYSLNWRENIAKLSRNPGIKLDYIKSNSISLADAVANSNSSNVFPDIKRSPVDKKNNKEILEELKKEASSHSDTFEIN